MSVLSRHRTSASTRGALAACILSLALGATGAMAAGMPQTRAGAWELGLLDTERHCNILLSAESRQPGVEAPASYVLAMPAGCRNALPILSAVGAWATSDNDGINLLDASGAPVLQFTPARGQILATGPTGEIYTLAKTGGNRVQMAQAGAATAPATRKPAPAPAAGNVRPSEIAGRYAVLRAEGKDTGCMVTLSTDSRARGYRAQLAPACRDQGIVIFDPISWTLERGHIALTARKGHKAMLELQPDGTWLKKDAKPLGLKKI